MTGKTHQILGLTVGLGYFFSVTPPEYGPATLGAVLVGSHLFALLPDLDQPAAKIWDSLPFGRTVGQMVDPFIKHRNISHSILGFGLVGLVIYILLKYFPVYWEINTFIVLESSLAAYLSHLLADMITVEGIPLLFPYTKMIGLPPKPFEGIRIITGKWFENMVIFPILNLILILLIWIKWEEIKLVLFK